MVIRIELQAAEAERALTLLLASMDDLTPVMQEVGEFLLASTERRYDEGVSPEGVPWAPKSPVTLARYARGLDAVDTRPLFKSGTMRRTLAYEAGPSSTAIGSNAIQAAVMQFGAAKGTLGPRSPWGDIPARPYLGLSEEDHAGVVGIVEEWMARLLED